MKCAASSGVPGMFCTMRALSCYSPDSLSELAAQEKKVPDKKAPGT